MALNPLRRTRRWLKATSAFRVLCSLALILLALSVFRQHFYQTSHRHDLRAREVVLGNCINLEVLRTSDECVESIDLQPNTRHRAQHVIHANRKQKQHQDVRKYVSSYGVVLDFDKSYNLFTSKSSHDEHYFTKRTLKCKVGRGMSVVWDFEFHTSMLHAYRSGTYGVHANTPTGTQVAASCPASDEESSAVMTVTINCGQEINRDAWGNPMAREDHAIIQTCTHMAWTWVKNRVSIDHVAPWAGLCHEKSDGKLHCRRNVFLVEGRKPVKT